MVRKVDFWHGRLTSRSSRPGTQKWSLRRPCNPFCSQPPTEGIRFEVSRCRGRPSSLRGPRSLSFTHTYSLGFFLSLSLALYFSLSLSRSLFISLSSLFRSLFISRLASPREPPLLLSTSNGCHSFRSVSLPREALECAGTHVSAPPFTLHPGPWTLNPEPGILHPES